MDYFVYAVALLLLIAVGFFVKIALFDRRPQKTALVFSVLAIPLFLVYYADRWPFGELPMRKLVGWLDRFEGADVAFRSDLSPAFLIAALLLVHLTVIQRVAAGQRLERLQDPIATFFGSTLFATLVGGVLVSTFHWGWVGAIIVAAVYALVYLGVVALLAAVVELLVEVAKLVGVWLKRRAFALATAITRSAGFVSSLAGRLGLRSLADKVRAEKAEQERTFNDEQEAQDRELYAAFLRDRENQMRSSGASEAEIAAEIAELSAPEKLAEKLPELRKEAGLEAAADKA